MDLAVIEKEAMLLPDTERAVLVDRLLASLNPAVQDQRLQWATEAESRFKAYQNGELAAVDGPQFIAGLRSSLGK